MQPYYEHAGITIYHGDCRDVLPPILPALEPGAVATDPPFGIEWRRGVNHARNSKRHDGIANDHDTSARDDALEILSGWPGLVFGSFYAPYPANVKQVLVWWKPPDAGLVGSVTGFRRDAEPIFIVGPWPQRTVERTSVLHVRAGQAGTVTETGHPHTKPVALMESLVAALPSGIIMDPFVGSGSTLVSAKNLGRRAIGIEIEERYCEIAAKRLAQEVLPFAEVGS